jgi:hypothetical protein
MTIDIFSKKSTKIPTPNGKKSIFSQTTIKFAHFYPERDLFSHNLGKIDENYSCGCGPTFDHDIIIHNSIPPQPRPYAPGK